MEVGTCSDLTIDLFNDVVDPASLLNVTAVSTAPGVYTLPAPPAVPFTIAGDGSTVQLTVRFCPTAAGPIAGTLTIESDNALNSPFTVSLNGRGTDPPACDAGGPYAGNVGDTINFDGSGSSDDGSIVSYDWDFGDGNTGTGVMPSNSYGASGLFTVTLTVTDDCGLSSTCTTTADIQQPQGMSPIIGVDPAALDFGQCNLLGQPVILTLDLFNDVADPLSILEISSLPIGGPHAGDFSLLAPPPLPILIPGDGTIVTLQVQFVPSASGTRTADLTINSPNGVNAPVVVSLTGEGNEGPLCDAGGPYSGLVGDTITFDGSGSSDSDGAIATYDWDFGDGNTGTGVMPTNVYGASGSFTVTLTVTDDCGASSTCTTTAEIDDVQSLSPIIGVDPAALDFGNCVLVGDSVVLPLDLFNDVADPTSILEISSLPISGPHAGDFSLLAPPPFPILIPGDGTIVTVQVQFTPTAAGTRTADLTINSPNAVNAPVVVGLTGEGNTAPVCDANGPYSAQTAEDITFDGSGSTDNGTIVSYDWDFGDGNTGSGVNAVHQYADNGVFTVTLTVTDDCGVSSSCTSSATILNRDPICDANGPYSAQTLEDITFDGSGSSDPDGTIVSYDWDFGDGNTGSGVNAVHQYADNGVFTVTLCVTDDDGAQVCCTSSATILNRDPICDANGPYSALTNEDITFDGSGSSDPDGSIVAYDWDFGDGNTGSGVTAVHQYADNGVFTVTLCVTDDDGAQVCCTSSATILNRDPVCDANGPYSAQTLEDITFDGSGSSDPDGTIASYDWDFGDGNTGSGVNAVHQYADDGVYTVTLCVTDDDGAQVCCTSTATITNRAPECDANGPYSAQTLEDITFDGSGSSDPDGTIASYDWDFGDGNTGSGVNAVHQYADDGVYTVTLCVTDDDGEQVCCSTTATITNRAPVCDANGPYSALTNEDITFDGSGSSDADGTIVSYDWDFGDGNTGSGVNAVHQYADNGVFTVTLCVTDDDGEQVCCTSSATILNRDPICDANGPYSALTFEDITFDGSGSSDPDGSIVAYDWDFGDGNTGSGVTAVHQYADNGVFTVTLCVTDDDGAQVCCTSSATILNRDPVCDANGPYSAQTLEDITFDGSGSSDPDGTIASYDWDFGDGNTGSGVNAVHQYADDGVYTVTLCVTDDDGAQVCCTSTATITNRAPECDANGPYSTQTLEDITFDGSGSSDPDGTIASYDWDFGDGNTGSGVNAVHQYADDGVYTVTLCVTDDDGEQVCCSTTATITNRAPDCDNGGPYSAQTLEDITFDGSGSSDADGSIVSYDWDFGDGNTGSGVTDVHQYADDGVYTVTLCVTDDDGAVSCCETTATITNQAPVCNANGPYNGQVGDTIMFDGSGSSDADGSIVAYDWDFGDGNTGSGVNATHVYNTDGTFTVTLCVTDDDGAQSCCTAIANITAQPNDAPLCDANGPYSGQVGDTIMFDGSGSSDSDGTIVSYDWDFGDGNTGSGVNATHVYTVDGDYTVTLCVTDDDGAVSCCTAQASIDPAPNMDPICDANGPYSAQTLEDITFDGSGSSDPDGTIVSYDWDFGDGNTGSGVNAVHQYADDGVYTVTLCVTDDDGAQVCCTTEATITNRAPLCDANGPYSGQINETITFDGSGSSDADGTIVAYDWDFGDGSTGSGVNATHEYAAAGVYTATLCVTDDDGDQSCCTAEVTITPEPNEPPVCDANGPYSAQTLEDITFDGSGSSDSDGTIVSYDWDFGDGNTGSGVNAVHQYADDGVYTVTLCVTDDDGAQVCCSTEATITNRAPLCDAGGPYSGFEGDTIMFDGSGSSDADGSIVAYDWDFGDGSTGSGVNATHEYATAGVYTATLCVTDDDGDQSCCTAEVTIEERPNEPPICDANGPYAGTTDEVITFDGSGSSDPDGTIVSYDWEFGDGDTGSGVNATHMYDTAGTYVVTLCVTDDDGAVSCCTSEAVIMDPVAVELASFHATTYDGEVTLSWSTSTENNNLGFQVYRAYDGSDDFEQLTEGLISGQNRAADYEFVDTTAEAGQTYTYQLEALDRRGSTQTFQLEAITVARVLPKNMVLHQNNPNPFNPSTSISFELAEAARVTLRIYDASGRTIRTLLAGEALPRDFHSVQWDGRDDNGSSVGSGMYIYRLQVGSTVLTRKMVLMK